MVDWTRVTQDDQRGRITTVLGKDAVYLETFTATERLSEPFSIVCEVLSPQQVDFTADLGTTATLEVEGDDLTSRYFHGVLTEASQTGYFEDATRYSLVLRPWFYLMQLGRNSRIFQKMTARDIIKQVFDEAGVATSAYNFGLTDRGLIVREYCVQFGESDFNFVSRLMEEEGIYYFFAHDDGSHVMTLCDAPSCHAPFDGGSIPINAHTDSMSGEIGLWNWSSHVRPALTEAALRDVHFKAPDKTNDAKQTSTEGDAPLTAKVYDYPGGFSYLTDDGATTGDAVALLRLQAGRAEKTRYTGEGDAFAIPVGSILTVQPAGGDDSTAALVTATMHRLTGQNYRTTAGDTVRMFVAVEGVPEGTAWRPPQRAVKPVARGPQTATVVGGDSPDDVINVDAFGRVQVWFSWDRLDKKNKSSSCWIRVSQAWADKGFGHMLIPRVGEEVVVDFLDGDMDRPLITGRVYNGTKTTPYALPDNKTVSTWKSQTVGKSGDYADTVNPPAGTDVGYNEIRFEDKGASEELYMYGHRNFKSWYRFDEIRTTGHNVTIDVGYNRTTTIKNDESKTVTDGNETHTVATGTRTTVIEGDETLTVNTGDRKRTIKKGSETLIVSEGDMSTEVSQGNQATKIALGNQTTNVDTGSVTVEAMQSITLKVGASSIVIDQASVTIKSTMINIEAQAITKVVGSGMVQVTGGIVTINT